MSSFDKNGRKNVLQTDVKVKTINVRVQEAPCLGQKDFPARRINLPLFLYMAIIKNREQA